MYSKKIWEILKPIANEIDIYEETVNEDPTTLEGSYIVYITDVTNTPHVRADGKVIIRSSNCEIVVFTEGNANDTDNKKFVNMVEDLLIQNEISYNKINLGFNSDLGRSQVTFDFYLN